VIITEPLPLRDLAACCTPVTDAPLTADAATALARTLKAIADPARLRIISIVSAHGEDSTCACDLEEPFALSQPTVSHHCKILVDAGILHREKRGTWAYYTLVDGALDSIAGLISTPV
jgi:ArsR family transcriptional regulator